MKKCISISIPCYNEEKNIEVLVDAIESEFQTNLPEYDYEIHFIDNASTDKTQTILRKICAKNKHVKAIFNGKNFALTSKFYGILQTHGDCTISMVADFQDPVNLITPFVKKWEAGYKVVLGTKKSTKENPIMAFLRKSYYRFMKKFSRVNQIEGFNGFGLYDKSFIDFLRTIEDAMPSFRGLVSEYAYDVFIVPYDQPKRKHGKSKNKFINLYNNAIINIVSYTKIAIRFMLSVGCIMFLLSILLGILVLFTRLFGINNAISSWKFIYIFILWVCSLQLVFIGILGEYIMEINYRLLKRPWVIEKERLNYE